MTLADLDDDGRLDIVVTGKLSGEVEVLAEPRRPELFGPSRSSGQAAGYYGVGVDGVSTLEATAGVVAARVHARRVSRALSP